MEFFNHVQNVYEDTFETTPIQSFTHPPMGSTLGPTPQLNPLCDPTLALDLDIPLAIFMIKLLSIKVDFSHFRDENIFTKYMESIRPVKLRYYLQVKFRDEMTKSTEHAIQEIDEEYKNIDFMFKILRPEHQGGKTNPNYEDRMYIYNKYLTDDKFLEEMQKLYINIESPCYSHGRGLGTPRGPPVNIKQLMEKWKFNYKELKPDAVN